jgi:hypothetical protein
LITFLPSFLDNLPSFLPSLITFLSSFLDILPFLVVYYTVSAGLEIRKKNMNIVAGGFNSPNDSPAADRAIKGSLSSQQRLMFQISAMAMLCLMVNLGVSVSLSGKITSWGESYEAELKCSLYETFNTHDFEGLKIQPKTPVCAAGEQTFPGRECQRECMYRPDLQSTFDTKHLTCDIPLDATILFILRGGGSLYPLQGNLEPYFCDCPCASLVVVETPRLSTMMLSYLAQSLVVCIVGINMAFTQGSLQIWKRGMKCFLLQRSTDEDGGGGRAQQPKQLDFDCPMEESENQIEKFKVKSKYAVEEVQY